MLFRDLFDDFKRSVEGEAGTKLSFHRNPDAASGRDPHAQETLPSHVTRPADPSRIIPLPFRSRSRDGWRKFTHPLSH